MIRNILASSWVFASLTVTASAQDATEPAGIAVHTDGIAVHADALKVELGKMAFRVPVEARTVKGAPYAAEVVNESTQTLADGNRIVQRSSARVYRDSQGRVRREEDRASGAPGVSISDPVAGVSFSLDAEKRIAFRSPMMTAFAWTGVALHAEWAAQPARSEAESFSRRLPYGAAQKFEKAVPTVTYPAVEVHTTSDRTVVEALPARQIEGVSAEGVRRTTIIPAGEIGNEFPLVTVSEEWFSPELQLLLLTERTDPRLGTSTYRLQNINRTEPPAYLFEVPSDYTVRSMEMFHKVAPTGRH
jgi:hypothetical protein